jgi:hypothetical protein
VRRPQEIEVEIEANDPRTSLAALARLADAWLRLRGAGVPAAAEIPAAVAGGDSGVDAEGARPA